MTLPFSLRLWIWRLNAPPLRTVSQALWIILSGWELFLGYAVASLALIPTIIGIAFIPKMLEIAVFSLNPIGRQIVSNPHGAMGWQHDNRNVSLKVMNVIWLILFGWEFFLFHVLLGVLQALTVFGIGNALRHWKIAKATLFPFGTMIIDEPVPPRPVPVVDAV